MDPSVSREARYSLHDFLDMYGRLSQYLGKAARDERIRVLSKNSEPPEGACLRLEKPCMRAESETGNCVGKLSEPGGLLLRTFREARGLWGWMREQALGRGGRL